MGKEVTATTTYHVTRLVGKRREYLVGASHDNIWAGSRSEASGWDTEEGAIGAAESTHDARSCVEMYTVMVNIGDPVYSIRT